MESHIKEVTRSYHFQLKNIGKLRCLIDKNIAHMLVHSFVSSRLDYSNCLYAGVPSYLLKRLQKKIQNKAARLVLRKGRKYDSKELLKLLHWLPVQKRVDFKIACPVFKSLNNLLPSYIQDLIELYKPTRALRSSASISLKTSIPHNSFVGRAFSFNALKSGIIYPMRREVVHHFNLIKNSLIQSFLSLAFLRFDNVFLLCCTVPIILLITDWLLLLRLSFLLLDSHLFFFKSFCPMYAN